MKDSGLIAAAVPVFLALIFLERLADGQDAPSFDLGDSVASLSCGVLSQVAAVLTAGLLAVLFGGSYESLARLAPVPLGSSPAAWALGVLGVDFAYYWWHRASHQVNVLWAMHVVHHQSARYNLTTALRQPSFSVLIGWVVYVPIALLGVPFKITLAATAIDTLYQFWIHTEKIGRLGVLEAFLNTPSHHRVHHGVNPKYIDKNYGGILIVWDRLFGTFQAEEERPTYGITTPFTSLSAAWANLHYWHELAELARRARSRRDKLKVWLMYPGWRPAGVAKAPAARASAAPSPARKYLSLALLAGAIALLSALYRVREPWTSVGALSALVAGLILSTGPLLEPAAAR